jgi:hypothetical protein
MSNQACAYSLSNRLGRPKGVKNKRAVGDSAHATSTRSNLQETTRKRPATNSHDVSTTASAEPEGMADLDRLVHANYPVLPDELDLFTVWTWTCSPAPWFDCVWTNMTHISARPLQLILVISRCRRTSRQVDM